MKKVTLYLTLILIGLMVSLVAQAGKPGSGEVFYVQFDGAVWGSAYSNPTENKGNIQNLVFNKPASQVVFNIDPAGFTNVGGCFGADPAQFPATMHLLEGYLVGLGSDGYLVARFWFTAGGISYMLELVDSVFDPSTGPDWSGDFPPFGGETIHRTAESWVISTTRNNVRGACTGTGNFAQDDYVDFVLGPDPMQ